MELLLDGRMLLVELWDVERGAPTMKLLSNDVAGTEPSDLRANLDTGKSAQVNCVREISTRKTHHRWL